MSIVTKYTVIDLKFETGIFLNVITAYIGLLGLRVKDQQGYVSIVCIIPFKKNTPPKFFNNTIEILDKKCVYSRPNLKNENEYYFTDLVKNSLTEDFFNLVDTLNEKQNNIHWT